MKIEAHEENVTPSFAGLTIGNPFWFASELWIKTTTIYNKIGNPLHNAVRLYDGYYAYFSSSNKIWTAKVKIVNEKETT